MKSMNVKALIIAALTLLLASCGSGGSGSPRSKTNLQVVSVSPTDQASDVSRTAPISITFATALPSSIDGNALLALAVQRDSGMMPVASHVELSANGKTLTLVADEPLDAAAVHQLLRKGGDTGIADIAGRRLPEDYEEVFWTKGGAWDATAQSLNTTANPGDSPAVALDGKGGAIAVWHNKNGSVDTIKSSRIDINNGTKTDAADLASGDMPRIAVAGNGAFFFASRVSTSTTNDEVWAGVCASAAGSCTTPVKLSGMLIGKIDAIDVAADANGNTLVVWRQINRVYVSRYDTAGAVWSTFTELGTGSDPAVAMNKDGQGLAVWRYALNANAEIRARLYRNGTWEPQQAIDAVTDGTTLYPPRVAARCGTEYFGIVWPHA